MIAQPLTYRCPHCGTSLTVEPSSGDDMLICPSERCGKPFKAEVPLAMPSSPLIFPEAIGGEAPPRPVAVKAVEAPAPEQELERIQLTMFRRYPVRLLLYSLLALAGVSLLIWAWVEGWPILAVLGAIAAGFVLVRLVAWWLRLRNTTVFLTDKRCAIKSGFFKEKTTEVLLENISDVQVNQGLLSRLSGVGDIIIVTNGESSSQIVLMGVASPEMIANRIRERR